MEEEIKNEQPYGILLHEKDLQLQKRYFKEMAKLIGVNVIFRQPKPNKQWTTYGEIDSNYYPPIIVACIFNEHPDTKTMKKLGWTTELQDKASIISLPYDLEGLQVGALVTVPDTFNRKIGRLFRIVELSSIMIAPASLTCTIVPEFEDTFNPALSVHTHDSLGLLRSEEDPNMVNG